MEPRLSVVTLGVADLARAVAFYRDVLGWRLAPQSVGDIAFFQAGGVVLGLYPRRLLAEDAAVLPGPDDTAPHGGVTLAHNVRAREDVDRVLAAVAAAGGRVQKPAADAFWGGRSGYFADPDGFAWEVAWNPGFPLDAEGLVRLEAPPAPARRAARPATRRRRPPARAAKDTRKRRPRAARRRRR